MNTTAYGTYKENRVMTASQGELILMMYDKAIECFSNAALAIKEKEFENKHKNLTRAQEIVSELLSSLNMDAGQVAQLLSSLYNYILRESIKAGIKNNASALKEFTNILKELRGAWGEIICPPEETFNNTVLSAEQGDKLLTGIRC